MVDPIIGCAEFNSTAEYTLNLVLWVENFIMEGEASM